MRESAPLIEESPVNIGCRVKQVLELGSHHMFIADVVSVEVDGAYMDQKGKFDLNRAGLMVYSTRRILWAWQKAWNVWLQCKAEKVTNVG